MLKIFACMAALGLLAGCQKPSDSVASPKSSESSAIAEAPKNNPTPNGKTRTLTPGEIDIRSPDNAVKTWWRMLDAEESRQYHRCEESRGDLNEQYFVDLSKVASKEIFDRLNRSRSTPCVLEKYNREITEVKVESETRAVVAAVIRNVTPLLPGSEPTKLDLQNREKGFRFRYLVERDDGGWKIAQVSQFNETNVLLNQNPWVKQFDNDLPLVRAYVYNQ